jgi:hypothetical protein
MRRRLRKFLPIVMLALAVQIFSPIATCWAASIASTDPLHAAVICHDDSAGSGQTDQSGQPRAHDGCCSICSVAHSAAPVATPQATIAVPYVQAARVVWRDRAAVLLGSRSGSHAQARAPPQLT